MESTFLYHAPCNICKSRNNLAVYSDHKYWFGCGYTSQQKSNMEKNTMQIETKFIKGLRVTDEKIIDMLKIDISKLGVSKASKKISKITSIKSDYIYKLALKLNKSDF